MDKDAAPNVRTRVALLYGPPGSGKTTHAQREAMPGDVVLDVDLLYSALSGGLPMYDHDSRLLPFVLAARDAVLRRLRAPSGARTAWIITTAATKAERAELLSGLQVDEAIAFEVEARECIRRIGSDDRRKGHQVMWADRVYDWWQRYER